MNDIPMSMRSPETELRYQRDKLAGKTTPLEQVPSIVEYEYFRIIHNAYEYDGYCEKDNCDMIVIKRDGVSKLSQFTNPERDELFAIIEGPADIKYDFLMLNMTHCRSIPARWHCHLLEKVKSRSVIKLY